MRFCSLKVIFLVLVVLFMAHSSVVAFRGTQEIKDQWHVVENKDADWPLYWLVHKKYPELKQEVFLAGPIPNDKPWLSDVIEVNRTKGIYLITYYAGQPGTSVLVDTYYALIYNANKHTILGHYPYRCTSSRYDYSPQWLFEENRILIKEEDFEPVIIDY